MKKMLLIAEKPSLMRDIQKTYQSHKNEIPYDIDFIALSGHICRLATPDKYPEWADLKWKEMNLPLIPKNWLIEVIPSAKNIYDDLSYKLKNNNYDGIIVATDADREGNFIYYLVETKLKIKLPSLRLWLNEGLTDSKILKAFLNMTDFHADPVQVNLTKASILRAMKDWLEGMNLTIGYSVASGNTTKIGRVKAPTIKLVYDNSMSIDNFKPETHYEIKALYKDGFDGIYFDNEGPVSFKTKIDAENEIKNIPKKLIVKVFEKKETKKYAPSLYNLTKIQSEAAGLYGYSPDRTLEIVQSLYETYKLVSYPRTDCNYVTSDISKEFPILLNVIKKIPDFSEYVETITESDIKRVQGMSAYVNDKEVSKSSHTALIPTGKMPKLSELPEDEYNIFKLICRRLLAIFLKPCVEAKTNIIATDNNEDYSFRSSGKVIIDKGFYELFGTNLKEKSIPIYNKGNILEVDSFAINDVTSVPPKRLTDATLGELMENVQKVVQDKNKKNILKESKGIGTVATRAKIIEDIIKDRYVTRKKVKNENLLFISDRGIEYIEGMKKYDFCSPEFAADCESNLKKVAEGKISFEEDMSSFIQFIVNTLNDFEKSVQYVPKNIVSNVLCTCPNCGARILENKAAYSCEKRCGVTLWKDNTYFEKKGIKMNKTIAKNLLEGKEIGPYKIKTSKGDAKIVIKAEIKPNEKYILQFNSNFVK